MQLDLEGRFLGIFGFKLAEGELYVENFGKPNVFLQVVPAGFRSVLKWIKEEYNDPEIIVTENGFSDLGEIEDAGRVNYYQQYLSALLEAIYEDKVNVVGYTAWSLLDNFEWMAGYTSVLTKIMKT